MKAVRLIAPGRPLEMQEIPTPHLDNGHVLVRIRAAGICHSDVHYRAGKSPVRPLPMTLGHEIAGVIERVGRNVRRRKVGDRICLHYLLSCRDCYHCSAGNEQFCDTGSMLGHYADGGYAEYIVVPERNAIPLPDNVPFEHGAILMCSSSTSFHALRKARLQVGETVAVFGVGGLGLSAIQLARTFGATEVFAVDIDAHRLTLAESLGATSVDAESLDPVDEILRLTKGKGVNVALELIGLVLTMKQAVRVLGVMGRAVMAGICTEPVPIDTYRELLGKEAEIIGTNDHLLSELPLLVDLARRGTLDLSMAVTRTIPLDAEAINDSLDNLEQFGSGVRTVILP
jgi:2-desacetyl-2-hydroxyethyl bacteriochlorophyllide A dehydrogenase